MTKLYSKLLLGLLFLLCVQFAKAQISVTATLGTTGPTTYTTLKAAFDAINAGTHKGAITVAINGNTTETATAVLNASAGTSSYTAIAVNASGAFTVTGNLGSSLISLVGATNVNINGNNTLQLVNTNAGGNVINFSADASGNTIRNTTIKGATNLVTNGFPTSGIIAFGSGTTTGNDNNTIDNCDVDGTGAAVCCLYSTSSSTTAAGENSGNTVKNSKFHDNINNSATVSVSMFLDGGSTDWIIQGNSFYHTAALSTAQQIVVRFILVLPDFTSDAHNITGNFLGGNTVNAGGTLSLTGTIAVGFIGLDVESAGPNNVIQNNTVRNVTLTYPNTGGSFSNAGIFAFCGGFNGTTNISNNTVSNFSFTNSTGFIQLQAIHVNARVTQAGTVTPAFTVNNNTINSITCNSGGGAGDIQMHGIRLETSSAASLTATAIANPTFTVSGNTLTNLNASFAGVNTFVRGIGTIGTQGGTNPNFSTASLFPKVDINNNNINTFTSSSLLPSYASGVCTGIHFGGTSAVTTDIQKINGNTISNLSGTATTDVGTVVIGILATTGSHEISKNKIYDLKNSATGATANAGLVGITVRSATAATNVFNNFISLGTSQTTNLSVFGILHNFVGATGPINVSFNSVVITGAGAAGNNKTTAGLLRGTESLVNTVVTPMVIKDNILVNTRTGGGSHFAIANTATAAGWTSDYNDLFSSTAGTVALWGTASNDLNTYKTNSGDVNSKSVAVNFINVANGDLHLTGASITDVNLKGTPITGITTDIDGETRNATTPEMGADEPNTTCTAPAITTQPTAQAACSGGSATFTVVATGTTVSYQWRKGTTDIAGATSASYTINPVAAGDAANYSVVVTNSCGTVTSNSVALTITAAAAITTQPTAQAACIGGSATFTVVATGTNVTYQWRKGTNDITNATSASYTINPVAAGDAANYSVVVTSSCGNVTSNSVALTVTASTAITTQPANVSTCNGTPATFTVAATGAGLTYQWRKGTANIANANSATYAIPAVVAGDAATYSVVVTGTCGSVTSNAVTLTVNACTAIPDVDADVTSAVLMPNVVRSSTVLRVQSRKAMHISWNITDVQGRVVMQINQQLTAGQNDLQLKLSQLAAGTYYLGGTTNKGRTTVLTLFKN